MPRKVGGAVIEDRMTARILGVLFILMPLIVVVSTWVMTPKESRGTRLLGLVVVPSVPFALFGGWLLKRAPSLPESEEDDQ